MMLWLAVHRALHSVIFKEWPSESGSVPAAKETTEHVWKRNSHPQAANVSLNQKSNKCVRSLVTSKRKKKKKKKTRRSLFSIVSLILFLLSHLPTTLSLPQGRLIKTNAIVGYHCYARAQRAAGSYFSFSLVWWCDFVFFRNRFVSNGSVYLSSLPPLFPIPSVQG